jgi:hypothetical protein
MNPFEMISSSLSRVIGRMIEYFAAYFGASMLNKWAYVVAITAAFIAIVLAFTLAINIAIHSIFIAMPSLFAFGQQFIPNNAALCISTYYTVQISVWMIYIKMTILKFSSRGGGVF